MKIKRFIARYLHKSVDKLDVYLTYLAMKQVNDHMETQNDHSSRDYIDAFLKEAKERRSDVKSYIRGDYLPGNVLNMFGGGTNSVNRSLAWNLLICAANPGTTQKRMQEEIDRVVGFARQPQWEDRYQMPFVMAFIREVHRWRTAVPVGIPRSAGEDVSVGSYVIPKDTIVMANIWAVHVDPNLWDNPEKFNPSRFLENGQLIAAPKYLIPFSVGKRMCPAEKVSSVTLFMFLTVLLQKFVILPEEGKKIDLSSDCITFNSPVSQKLRFTPRARKLQAQ
ncbi:cytochrome P450 2J2 [Ixodes scapularis]|uniref:cytochrome P450 2J2 n=1 Tax=Ixodes scapularis TaxID=6945 RepID=UPI001A9D441A|nr:cytochrome P450 2J2 [Ixodes scapularis]